MPSMPCKPSDTIVLKSRNRGDFVSRQNAKIITVLPETRESISFRVHLEGENFDRNVSHDDIETTELAQKPDAVTQKTIKSGGWINHDLVRTKK